MNNQQGVQQKNKSNSDPFKIYWTKILYDYHVPIDTQLFAKWDGNIEIEGKQVLEKDIPRTRCQQLQMQKQSFKDVLRRIAAFYCLQNGVSYQQGLLEVVYPFALLRRKQFPTKKCYAYFNAFMKKHLPKVLTMRIIQKKKQLPYTVFAISLTECLLRFHFPQIYRIFKQQQIHLSMIITQQLMTVFAKNTDIRLVYKIFDYFIKKNNPNYLFYMCIALIGLKQQQIMESAEQGTVHAIIKNIKDFKTDNDLQKWFKFCEQIQKKTPQSFNHVCDQFGFSQRSILSYQQLQNMIHSDRFFTGSLLTIQLNQIKDNPGKFVFVSVQNKVIQSKHKFKSLTISEIQNQNKKLQKDKIYVLAIRQNKRIQDLQALVRITNQYLKQVSVIILKSQLLEKRQKCSLF